MSTKEQALVEEIRQEIKRLPPDVQIQIQAITMTLRNILKADPRAAMAFALVGAEMAAR